MNMVLIIAICLIALLLFLLHKVNKMVIDIDKEHQKDIEIKENAINSDFESLCKIEKILDKKVIYTQDIIKCIKIASLLASQPDEKINMIDKLTSLLNRSIQNGGRIN